MVVADAIQFIRKYDKNKMHKWLDGQLALAISNAIKENCFVWSVDESGEVTGILFASMYNEAKEIHVDCIVCKPGWGKENLRRFFIYFIKNYPAFTLTSRRRERFTVYNTHKLYKRLQHVI